MSKVNLSQLKPDRVRCIIPVWLADEHVGDIEIKNPELSYVQYIKEQTENGIITDELKLDMIKTLTDINIDCEMDESFFHYYSPILTAVMIEIDSILFEITTDKIMETYSLNKMSTEKQEMLANIFSQPERVIEAAKVSKEEREKIKKIKQLEKELSSLKGGE